MNTTAQVSFKPKQVTKHFLSVLPRRAQDVITKRYGLGGEPKKMTLEAIGESYGITRERVRQIENFALAAIRKSDVFKSEGPAFEELRKVMVSHGGLVPEQEFLQTLGADKSTQNHAHFLLVLGDLFVKHKEDEDFTHRWSADHDTATKVHESLRKLYASLSDDDLIEEAKMIDRFLTHLKDVSEEYKNNEIVRRWLSLSKKIGKNPLGEWGVAHSPNVNARGVRDYAFLVLRKHGSPMHFTEVAKAIGEHFDKRAHVATTHNELIKDKRFVLVGRGLYALSEWGYSTGVVRDVIADVLKKHGPLSREEIIDKVMRERYVKPNTIMVNLQNQKYFKKSKEGRYSVV
ncbi:MAG: sigma factor-like helix-turn-helix DNA-binding protein [bacterium]|nr:sigma factor-like helix-turn-helix DNA-binding protein [bacterium]